MRRSDIPYDVEEKMRLALSKVLTAMLLFRYGAYHTHHSRDLRDGQILLLLKQVYEELSGDTLWHSELPRFELWHEKSSIFDTPEGESVNGQTADE